MSKRKKNKRPKIGDYMYIAVRTPDGFETLSKGSAEGYDFSIGTPEPPSDHKEEKDGNEVKSITYNLN